MTGAAPDTASISIGGTRSSTGDDATSAGHSALEPLAGRSASAAPDGTRTMSASAGTAGDVLLALAELAPGQRIGDFELLRLLGQGGSARVFLARQCSMQRLVALKVSANRGAESITLAQLDHPNIVRVYDQRQLPAVGLRLLYMQYAAGGTLREIIAELEEVAPARRSGRDFLAALERTLAFRGVAAPAESAARAMLERAAWSEVVCLVGAELAEALEYAHQRGVVHRDIKPANILLDDHGKPMLADFNVSSFRPEFGQAPATIFGGSPGYMSPEQLRAWREATSIADVDVDGRSDIYSLGLTLWELFTGRRPAPGRALAELPAGLPARGCCGELASVLRRCLVEDRALRWQSAAELARELRLCLQPEVRRVQRGAATGRAGLAARHAAPLLLACALVPNGLAGVFNYVYNRREIIERLGNAYDAFMTIQAIINGIAFPLGLGLLFLLARPLTAALRHGAALTSTARAAAARRAATLGHLVAIIGVSEWLVAGLAYPVSLHAFLGSLHGTIYCHFAASLALCGLIAAAYPFFCINYLVTEVFYPVLCQAGTDGLDDAPLAPLRRQLDPYLLLAGAVPFVAVAVLALAAVQNQFALGMASLVGVLGFCLAFAMYRKIRRNIDAIEAVLALAGGRGLGVARRH